MPGPERHRTVFGRSQIGHFRRTAHGVDVLCPGLHRGFLLLLAQHGSVSLGNFVGGTTRAQDNRSVCTAVHCQQYGGGLRSMVTSPQSGRAGGRVHARPSQGQYPSPNRASVCGRLFLLARAAGNVTGTLSPDQPVFWQFGSGGEGPGGPDIARFGAQGFGHTPQIAHRQRWRQVEGLQFGRPALFPGARRPQRASSCGRDVARRDSTYVLTLFGIAAEYPTDRHGMRDIRQYKCNLVEGLIAVDGNRIMGEIGGRVPSCATAGFVHCSLVLRRSPGPRTFYRARTSRNTIA